MAEIITAKELADKIINNEEIFLLDVRNPEEFAKWNVAGKYVHNVNHPYFDLLDGLEPIKGKLPENKEIIVICAKGGSSEMVAELLAKAGYHARSLTGGMKAWSEHLQPVKIGDLPSGGELYQFVRLGKGCLSYLIVSDGEAAIIDPARMINIYQDFAHEKQVKIKAVLDTHLHADHISGGRSLAEEIGTSYYLPSKDAEEVTYAYTALEEGLTLKIGAASVAAIDPVYSPGHTKGSTSIIVDDKYLMTGDILFVKSIGRPDLAGKASDWVDDLRHTLYKRFTHLDQDLIVLPAHFSFQEELHGNGSVWARLGDLYKQNSGLQVKTEQDFRKLVTENLPPQPNAYQEIRKTNMGKIDPDEDEKSDMETGPNNCAIEA
ncbi:MBL fold metallo-hydrolase [Virgibacillus halophilus]|uniref:MBL fold metallo-hydrolase n=1 Tax=Tigheibacillus halophilus TaxID=361280 RepID=UPI003625F0F2